jgi:adenosine kinase
MLVSNDYELGMITNTTGLDVAQLLCIVDTIVTTKGEQGCEIVSPEGVVRVPVVPTENAIDPTGAGDAFRGGLIKGLTDGKPIQRCVEMGTVAAHYAVQVSGTQNYTFTPAEFTETLEECFGG